ncbi:hydrolase [Longispora fulva]|uniref:HAD family hydrolase n=1 Tax=Longispora fulva TaxID=619741 RepID=UPI0018C9EBC3|nr:HAD family hydrolase [Longispora fulva]GIG61312.1 hydrolase [Longispora fulva]
MVQSVTQTEHPPSPRRPVEAVLVDFHGTLAQVEDATTWLAAAAQACGTTLEGPRATILLDRLLTAGRAGGPMPARIPPQLAEVWAERDLYPHAHRAAYAGLAATVQSPIEGLADALYDRVLLADGWVPYADTVTVLSALKDAGIPTALVSNIGFDLRPICEALGFGHLITEWVLSYELGRCKPEKAVFTHACTLLGVPEDRALMVGDSPADGAAVAAGLQTLLLPASPPGAVHGLSAILDLVS